MTLTGQDHPQRRQVISLAVPAFIGAALANVASAAPSAPPPVSMTKIDVYPRDGHDQIENVASAEVTDVCVCLHRSLSRQRAATTDDVRRALARDFGASVITEESFAPHYKQVWVIDHWETRCCNRTVFALGFRSRPVVVDVDEIMGLS